MSKCSSLAIQGSSGKLFDPHLIISIQNIPFANKPIKFLGMRVEVPHNTAESKSCLVKRELHQNLSLSRRKFKASVAVQEVMMLDPDFTRRSLTARVKGYVQAADDVDRLDNLQRLEKEGQMSRLSTPQAAEIWAKAVERLPDEIMRFSLNSAVDTPTQC